LVSASNSLSGAWRWASIVTIGRSGPVFAGQGIQLGIPPPALCKFMANKGGFEEQARLFENPARRVVFAITGRKDAMKPEI
jgi:hypothetical protein